MYQHSLLWGLLEAWRAKKAFEWGSVLEFMGKIVNSKEFWEEEYDKGYNYRNWIISEMASLIKEGTKDDNHSFDSELLPKAEEILLKLADRTESQVTVMDDLVTAVLNSTRGKIFSAMINYCLRVAPISKKRKGDRWVDNIRTDFTKRLDRRVEPSLEFSVIVGEYLPNLYYLDEKWVIDNLNEIFPKYNDFYWQAAFTGYLFYSAQVYQILYFLLRENNHYTKAIETNFADPHITERLAQHICVGYLEDWEKLEDDGSLIRILIGKRNTRHLLEIVNFFWMQRDNPTLKLGEKIKPLWKLLFDMCIQSEQNPEIQKIISNLSKWLSLIDEIDEQILVWLMSSAKYIQADFNTTIFIDYLLKHARKTPANVGRIYLNMLDSGIYPDFKMEDIQELVQILYGHGQTEIANRICILYMKKGYNFLDVIYEKNRNVKA